MCVFPQLVNYTREMMDINDRKQMLLTYFWEHDKVNCYCSKHEKALDKILLKKLIRSLEIPKAPEPK